MELAVLVSSFDDIILKQILTTGKLCIRLPKSVGKEKTPAHQNRSLALLPVGFSISTLKTVIVHNLKFAKTRFLLLHPQGGGIHEP